MQKVELGAERRKELAELIETLNGQEELQLEAQKVGMGSDLLLQEIRNQKARAQFMLDNSE